MANNNFINQFPYSDFHELNLDWLINKTKELQTQMADVQATLAEIEVLTEDQINTMIQEAINTNNLQLYQRMTQLKADITTEYKAYCDNQIRLLTIYVDNQDVYYDGLAHGYADQAYSDAKDYIDTELIDYTMMINPITGKYEDVRDVVNDIVSYFHTQDALTAGEYDALDLTAGAYDAYDITAYDYDFSGKTILNP